jgi:tRNA pseudouridine38-40 synthase
VTPGFDPRRHAVGRVYRYTVRHGDDWSPLQRRQSWQVPHRLDVDAMASAAEQLPRALRDWAAFAGPVPEGYPTVRTLRRCDVRPCGDRALTVTLEADGFLPHQVRRTVGALERVGAGRLEAEAFAALVDGPPGSVGPTAPPQGLTLVSVQYARGTVTWDDDDEDLPAER